MTDNESDKKKIRRIILLAIFMIMLLGPITIAVIIGPQKVMSIFGGLGKRNSEPPIPSLSRWQAPDINTIPANMEGDAIRYGRALITNTSEYLGPNGKVMAISNGMNCQNCHLEAGTKYLGNNFSAVASTYPKFRARSGSIETIEKRVNDCIERSLNGQALKNDSREMKAMIAYIKWVGSEVPIGQTPAGAGLMDLPYLDIAADRTKGKLIYDAKCSVCHGKNGEGMKTTDNLSWTNPPLWGVNSYNTGAGLYRLSRLAGYVKVNMPFGANADNTQVTDEEAWHVAAFINSMDRPVKDISRDWPDISTKPVDHPFGPFADDFTEKQHKYGPFKPILALRKRKPSR